MSSLSRRSSPKNYLTVSKTPSRMSRKKITTTIDPHELSMSIESMVNNIPQELFTHPEQSVHAMAQDVAQAALVPSSSTRRTKHLPVKLIMMMLVFLHLYNQIMMKMRH